MAHTAGSIKMHLLDTRKLTQAILETGILTSVIGIPNVDLGY
jgi:hypothetical protein